MKYLIGFKKLLPLIMLLTVCSAHAGTVTGGTISLVFSAQEDVYFVYLNQNITDVAACGSANANRFSIKPSTPGGKAMIATVLFASAQGKAITVQGTGDCGIWGDTESAKFLWTNT